MKNQDWVILDVEDLNPPQIEETDGVCTRIFLSPYDIPIAVRGYFNKSGWFIIEFQYIVGESVRSEHLGCDLVLYIGKNSRRLYQLKADYNQTVVLGVSVLGIITKAITAIGQKYPKRKANYDVVKRVILDTFSPRKSEKGNLDD